MKRIKVKSSRISALSLLLGLSLVAVSLIHPLGVGAATLTVTTTADSGPGSLRDAINTAAPGDTITFTLPAGSTITLTSGPLGINKSLTITGPGANQLTVARSSAGGTANFRIFDIFPGPNNVTISGLTITNGNLTASGASGGGVLSQSSGVVNFTAVTISNNTIDSGGAVGGGIASTAGTLNITGSTISGNTIGTGSEGGGIAITSGTFNLTNSTVSGNTAGATSVGAGIFNAGTATLTFDTVTNNTTGVSPTFTGTGGGFANFGTGTIKDTIIAGNTAAIGPDIFGTIISQGYNLIGNNSGGTITPNTGDQIGTPAAPINPLLGPLVNNGGPTFTHALLTGSPAIDKGAAAVDPATGAAITTDQRGFARPVDFPAIPNAPGGNGSDIGAFEVQGNPTAVGSEISGTVTNNGGAPVAGVVVRLGGSGTDFTITDAAGHYEFDNLNPDGFYTVTPSRVDLSFAPSSRAISLAGNRAEAVFTATANVRPGANPLDMPEFFVRQQYVDFLNREPDATGFKFWTNEINKCGANQSCIEQQRVNVSAAYFLSTEFQQTGYLAYRTQLAGFGSFPRYADFLRDAQMIGQGVVVGQPGYQDKLEANIQRFMASFVARADFIAQYPLEQTAQQFVSTLNANTGNALSTDETTALVAALDNHRLTRAEILRRVSENDNFKKQQFTRAFVLMQYFGYLRRNPDATPDMNLEGYNFWLRKLDSFGGDYNQAEMVKAFVNSTEYRRRFVQE